MDKACKKIAKKYYRSRSKLRNSILDNAFCHAGALVVVVNMNENFSHKLTYYSKESQLDIYSQHPVVQCCTSREGTLDKVKIGTFLARRKARVKTYLKFLQDCQKLFRCGITIADWINQYDDT